MRRLLKQRQHDMAAWQGPQGGVRAAAAGAATPCQPVSVASRDTWTSSQASYTISQCVQPARSTRKLRRRRLESPPAATAFR